MGLTLTLDDVEVVGIHHRCIGIKRHANQTVEGSQTDLQLVGLRLQQHVVGFGLFGNMLECLTTGKIISLHLLAVLETVCRFA